MKSNPRPQNEVTLLRYYGIDVRFSASILLEKLGKPSYQNPNPPDDFEAPIDLIDLEWCLETDSGIKFYLYCPRAEKDPKTYQDFRIAAETKENARIAADCLIHFVIYGNDEYPTA